MNQNIEKLRIIPFTPSTFPRQNKCIICKKDLVEEILHKSTTPEHPRIGVVYESFIVGGDIYCPACNLMYKLKKTDSATLGTYYEETKMQLAISMVRLKEEFTVSQFDTFDEEKNIPKGTILYLNLTPDASQKKFNQYITTIRKLKSGLEREKDGYYENIPPQPRLYNEENWEKIPALVLALNQEDVSGNWRENGVLGNLRIIPISMLDFPDEFYPDYPEGNLISQLDIK